MGLFKNMNFRSASGVDLRWKIECDALDDEDIECLATICMDMIGILAIPSKNFIGVPRGGIRLANRLQDMAGDREGAPVVIDDVLTTGESVSKMMKEAGSNHAIVIFARTPCPYGVYALFQTNWFLDVSRA